jgi:hypothetical protein
LNADTALHEADAHLCTIDPPSFATPEDRIAESCQQQWPESGNKLPFSERSFRQFGTPAHMIRLTD